MDLVYTIRSRRWLPLLIAAVVSAAVVAVQHASDAAKPLQGVSILLASTLGFALDDPAAEVMAASPTSLLRRRLCQAAIAATPVVSLWCMLRWIKGAAGVAEGWAFITMFAGLVGLSLGIAGVAARKMAPGRGGIAVGPALFAMVLFSTTLPPRWRPMPLGDIPGGWPAIYMRWTGTALVGMAVFIWSSRDPARRSGVVGRRGG